ncbi:MAG: DUF3098 domain-containing protein [Saprospiraceae bacterium]|jgi:hypothetical protein|nr:DUF3098 domain-containing protein [Saprospiraceae bacterium]MBK9568372.1 DUF3098 domain-containing protein [Saprospiraceae bacterium]MBL0102166.1 DUF3098 domain-containing protein [Saprospiraceae bacterium]MBP6447416.1 DUF3098 domain-containing protein [Saprospiraceae bacterium]
MAKEKAYTRKVTEDSITSTAKTSTSTSSAVKADLLFGKNNYKFILIGVGLIFLGMILMTGGHMPSPDVWDESLIYSHRRITVAPILILVGLVINIYAIFVKK